MSRKLNDLYKYGHKGWEDHKALPHRIPPELCKKGSGKSSTSDIDLGSLLIVIAVIFFIAALFMLAI